VKANISNLQAGAALRAEPWGSVPREDALDNVIPARRVKLVFLIRALIIGGAERQLVTLAKRLDPRIFDVTVICLYGGGPFEKELVSAGVPVISLNKKGRREVLGFFSRLIKLLRDLRPDILHSYLTLQDILTVLVKPLLPGMRAVWGVRIANMNIHQLDWLSRWSVRLAALLSRFANLIIFNSVAGQKYYLEAGFAASRTIVIPNGIDTDYFAPNTASRSAMRMTWQVPDNSLLIGIVGRFVSIKDHPNFLSAAAILAHDRPDARFVCVGGGTEERANSLRALSEELGLGDKVTWAGFVSDMRAAYNAMDICCCSSAGEALSNAICEAMACGVPCVVTDVGDSSEVVGDTGVVVPPCNPQALATGWAEMARRISTEPQLGRAVRERISSQLSTATLVDRTSKALLNLL